MNKWFKTLGVIAVVAIVGVLGVTAIVSAQGPETGVPFGGWHRGGPGFAPMGGILHSEEMEEEMHAAIADTLGLSVEEFDAARAEGQTLWQIAEAQGVDVTDVWAAMDEVRAQAIQQALDEGLITQEQADWMSQYGGPGKGFGLRGGFGPCTGDGTMTGPRGFSGGRGMRGVPPAFAPGFGNVQ